MNTISGFKPVAKSDNGICERCGTLCPKQTVLMASCDEGGIVDGLVTAHWGVCCAAQYCFGTKSELNRKKVNALIEKAESERKMQIESWLFRIATGTTHTYRERKYTGSGYSYLDDPVTVDYGSVMGLANKLFSMTGMHLFGTFGMAHQDGRIVRTTGKPDEVAFYSSLGFVRCTPVNQVYVAA